MLSLVAFVLPLFRLPESLPPEQRRASTTKRAGMGTYFARPVLRDLLVATVIVVAAVALFQSTLALFTADRLGVGPRTLGWIYGFVGVVSVVIQGGVIGPLTRRFGAQSLTRIGAILVGVGMGCIPLSHSIGWLLFALGIFGVGSALFNPSMSGLVATAAEPHERGSVLGAYQGAASMGRVIGPFAASGVASASSLSIPFLVGAVVSLGGALLIHTRPKTKPPE